MASLHAFVLAAALAGSGDFVLLDFGSESCGPCRTMEPTVRRLEEAGYPVRRVNVNASQALARRFAVGPIPCFVLVKNGQEVQRIVGSTSYDRLLQMFHQAGYASQPPLTSGLRGQSPDRMALPATQPTQPHVVPIDTSWSTGGPSAARNPRMPQPTAVTNSLLHHQLTPAHQLALQATVRLRVADTTGQSKGTGTIIDVHGDEALIVTCGHIFRESEGKGDVLVDLFAPGSRGPVPGHVLIYECDRRDFALVSIRLNVPVMPVKVATSSYHPQKGVGVFSVGCNHGADPTVRVSTISAIDRYMGPPNIEIHGHPVEGRSGGGLFTEDGRIIGVCNAADLEEDRGIYAALPTIHLALERIGQRRIYSEQTAPPVTLANDTRPSPAPPRPAVTTPLTSVRQNTPARRTQEEVICIVRAPDGTTRIIVVENPSAELLQLMAAESQQQALPARYEPPRGQDIAQLSELPPASSGPLIRAQGY